MADSPKLPLRLMNATDKDIDRLISIIITEKGSTPVVLDPTCSLNEDSLNKLKKHGITVISLEKINKFGISSSKDPLPYIPDESPEGGLFEVIDMKNPHH
jgi:hypothetical protein